MAKGTARIRPRKQPATAICRVSSSFQPIGTMRVKSGGNMFVSKPDGANSRPTPRLSLSSAGAVAISEDAISPSTSKSAE
jgi:hypothetical protein